MFSNPDKIMPLSTGLLSLCGTLLITIFHLVVTAKAGDAFALAPEL